MLYYAEFHVMTQSIVTGVNIGVCVTRFRLWGGMVMTIKANKPKYKHDCDVCIFLGRRLGYDVYIHVPEGTLGTIVLRYGDEGSYYHSRGLDMLLSGVSYEK